MENLSQKYLNLLGEYEALTKANEELQKKVQGINPATASRPATPPMSSSRCEENLSKCGRSNKNLFEQRTFLRQELKKLYSLWLPPKVDSFFKTIIPWIKKGFKKSDQAEYRFEICQKCEYLKENNTCKLCGCFMKGKVTIPQASCPIGKWKSEEVKKST
jgi:hypothetical protein